MPTVDRTPFVADTPSSAHINKILDQGGVIAFPTETFYALGADPFNPDAVKRVFEIKERAADQPLLVLIDDLSRLTLFTSTIPKSAHRLMDTFWPGPLTLLFPARPSLPRELLGNLSTIGIRQPGNPFTLDLLKQLNRPLTGTSANRSGSRGFKTARAVQEALGESVDYIVDGPIPVGDQPSTILDVTAAPPRVVREGAIDFPSIQKAISPEAG